MRRSPADAELQDHGDEPAAEASRARAAARAGVLGLVILAIAAVVAVLSLPRILGGARDTAFDPSNPPADLALCRAYIMTGPHASPGADALVVDSVPGQPVRLPDGAGCPLVLEVRTPDGSFIQYVGSEESP